MTDYDDCIIYLLAKAYQTAHGNFKKRLSPYGLTPIQHLILEVLWKEEGLSASEIGKRAVLDNATLSGVLDRLADGGWIEKRIDSKDKRYLRIFLSTKAHELRATLAQARQQSNDEILVNLSLEEKLLLKRLLKDLRD